MTSEHATRGNDLALVEAALFLASEPLTRRALAKILGGVQLAYVDGLLEDLAPTYDAKDRGLELRVEDGRAMLRVKAEYVDRVAHLAPQQDIPRPILRTLAIIAYNHPMTQADLVKVRGNKAYNHVQALVDRGLIRTEEAGRTLRLYATAEFLRHFGLRSIEEFRFHVTEDPATGLESPEGSVDMSPERESSVGEVSEENACGEGMPSMRPREFEGSDSPESEEPTPDETPDGFETTDDDEEDDGEMRGGT